MNTDVFEKIIVNIRTEIEFPVYTYSRYGTPEYWKQLEISLKREVREFQEFIRDHRSRDDYGINIVRDYEWKCKFCGYTYPENYDGPIDCCDEAMDAEDAAKQVKE